MKALKKRIAVIWKYFSQDKSGQTVLWQNPNPPLIGWALFRILAHLFSNPHLKTGFEFIGSAFLFAWAYLEITRGASYFRRLVGIIVITLVCASYFR